MSKRQVDSERDPALEQRLREAFERRTGDLDPWLATRLSAARRAAREAASRGRSPSWRWALPAGLAVALILSLGVWQPWQAPTGPASAQAGADEMEMMLSDENLELYADLDFYAWLGDDDARLQ